MVDYEGQSAVEFEQMADVFERGVYPPATPNRVQSGYAAPTWWPR